jgi:murein L,D-transpeptidase YcbB/YkuD
MLHYLADLRVGHVRSEYHTTLPDPRLNRFDPVEQLRAALQGERLAAAVDAAAPRIDLYRRVRTWLARYRELAQEPLTDLPPLPGGQALRAGAAYAGAGALQDRLALLEDLGEPAQAAPTRLTPALVEGLKHFQHRHGLLEDGVLTKATLAALNVPLSQRVRQLELTLERLRWLPDVADGPLIAVNLPSYRLWAFSSIAPGVVPLEMRVIVGKSVKTQTPLFVGQMRYLEFNPYWNVPPSIQHGEIVPKLARDPNYLVKNDMEIVATSAGGPATLEALRRGTARVRQRPGARNALGAVKFAMPNSMNIYLHSTSAQELFQRSRRDLSHGCIRVEKPRELAGFVLADQPAWTAEKIEAAMRPGPTRTVNLKRPIPVVLFYATAVVDRENHVLFADDVYGRDPLLEKALAQD